MIFLEPCAALEMLNDQLRESAAGSGRLLLVSGGLGSGKTQLLHDFSEAASESGGLVLAATASRSESHLHGGVIEQLFSGPAVPPDMAGQISKLVTIDLLTSGDGIDPPQAQRTAAFRLMLLICKSILDLSMSRPVIIVIDDIHFADPFSLQVLLCLVNRMRLSRISIVLTERDWPWGTRSYFRTEMARSPHHRIGLAPMSPDTLTQLISWSLGPSAAMTLAPSFHDLSGGNPLIVRALLEDYCAAKASDQDNCDVQPVVGKSFGQAVLGCVRRWEPEIFDVAAAVAIFGANSSPEIIGSILGMTRDSVLQILGVLTDSGFVANGRLRHEVAASALLDDLPAQQRCSMHMRAAELLYQQGSDSVTVAEHLVAAGRAEGNWSPGVLRAAAHQMLSGGDIAFSVRCLELAMHTSSDEENRSAFSRVLLHASWCVNPSTAISYRDKMQQAMGQAAITARDVLTLVRLALWQGDMDAARAALAASRESQAEPDARTSAEIFLTLYWFYGPACTRVWDSGEFSAAPGKAVHDPWIDAARALARVWTHGSDDASSASAEYVLQSFRLEETPLEVVLTALTALAHGGHTDRAMAWCCAMIDEATARGARTWQALLEAARAEISLRSGDPATAARHADAALSLLPAHSWGILLGYPLSTLLRANTALGKLDAAAALSRQAVPDAMLDTVIGMRYLHARGQYQFASERLFMALDDFRACQELAGDKGMAVPALVSSASDLAEAYLRLGNTALAHELAMLQLDQQGCADARTRGISLYVLAASKEPPERATLLRQAIEHLRASGDQPALARAESALQQAAFPTADGPGCASPAYRSVVTPSAGIPPSSPALPSLASAWPPRAQQVISVAEHPVLSKAERRVAELAVYGHTNQEISRYLWITVSTVEQHLTRVYRKLGVRGRADLPRLARLGVSPSTAR